MVCEYCWGQEFPGCPECHPERFKMKEEPLYRCTVCGRIGTVGRCCGTETREPLNDLAYREILDVNNTRLIWVIIENDRGCGTALVKAYESEEEAKANLCSNEYVDWVELVVDGPENQSDE